MLRDAARAWLEAGMSVDRDRAFMIGDTIKDAKAAAAFGIPCILLATTYSRPLLEEKLSKQGVSVFAIDDGLPEAINRILEFVNVA